MMLKCFAKPCIAAWLLACALTCIKGQSSKPDFDLWSDVNVEHVEYLPMLTKHSNPPDVVGQSWKLTAQHADGNLAAYFHTTNGRSAAGRVAPPFHPQHYIALVNVERRLIYFKPTLTASTSLWRAWIAPRLCPPRTPGEETVDDASEQRLHNQVNAEDVEVIPTDAGPITIAKDPTCRAGMPLHECVLVHPSRDGRCIIHFDNGNAYTGTEACTRASGPPYGRRASPLQPCGILSPVQFAALSVAAQRWQQLWLLWDHHHPPGRPFARIHWYAAKNDVARHQRILT